MIGRGIEEILELSLARSFALAILSVFLNVKPSIKFQNEINFQPAPRLEAEKFLLISQLFQSTWS